jgi:predicted MFS family arabinose efflux permease
MRQAETAAERGAAAGAAPVSRAYARYALLLLLAMYTLNHLDRHLMVILLEPIKREFGASDTAMGLLTGFAFAVLYTIAGLPIARWADRGVRRSIIAWGLLVWSSMTAVTGLVRSFGELLLARVAVGVGEAAGAPPAHSLLSDYFPPERRATALALFATGGTIGMALGLFLGGRLGELFGWRATFVALGLPGVALALVLRLTLREPPRGLSERRGVEAEPAPLGEVLRTLGSLRSFVYMGLAGALHSFSGFASTTWSPTFLIRVHGMTLAEVGSWLAPAGLVTAMTGMLLGGTLTDRWGARDRRAYMVLPGIASLLAFPFTLFFLLWPEPIPAILVGSLGGILGGMWTGPTFAMVQGLARPRMRALAIALVLFVINLVGMGLGPLAIGALNDRLAPWLGVEAVRYSLLILWLPHLLGATCNLLSARHLRADLARQGSA